MHAAVDLELHNLKTDPDFDILSRKLARRLVTRALGNVWSLDYTNICS